MKLDNTAKYRESHEWAKKEGSVITVGISDHAQEALGDIVFVELPEVGKIMKQGDIFGVVESVKAASDIYMPMSGKVVAVNNNLEGSPDIVNKDAFNEGWIIKLESSNSAEWDSLLSASDYEKITKE